MLYWFLILFVLKLVKLLVLDDEKCVNWFLNFVFVIVRVVLGVVVCLMLLFLNLIDLFKKFYCNCFVYIFLLLWLL